MTTIKRVFGIGLVWFGCATAWVILGSTLMVRSDATNSSGSYEVRRLWGEPMEQHQPSATYTEIEYTPRSRLVYNTDGTTQQISDPLAIPHDGALSPASSEVEVDLNLEQRRRGLNWYPTYAVDLEGKYRFENDGEREREVAFHFPFPSSFGEGSNGAVLDGFMIVDEGGAQVPFEMLNGGAAWTATMAAGESREFQIRYASRGTTRWSYRMSVNAARLENFRLHATTDFENVDFPEGFLSPSDHRAGEGHWEGTWDFDSLIASQPIGVEMPTRMNPGPLAARISFFAPVSLLFFFFVVAVLAIAKKKEMHPMHYFFLGCSFFAFHLLLAYLVDHLSIGTSFAISATASMILAISYARLFVGWRFALLQIGIAQALYLVLFSSTFMWEGFTGLSITVGAVLTLFVMMQITGKMSWSKPAKPAASPGPGPVPSMHQAPMHQAPMHQGLHQAPVVQAPLAQPPAAAIQPSTAPATPENPTGTRMVPGEASTPVEF